MGGCKHSPCKYSSTLEVPPSGYGLVYSITSNAGQNKKSYQVIIGNCIQVL
jgi:hypothetical protein